MTGELKRMVGELKRMVGELKRTAGELKRMAGELKRMAGELKRTTGELKRTAGEGGHTVPKVSSKNGLCRSSLRDVPPLLRSLVFDCQFLLMALMFRISDSEALQFHSPLLPPFEFPRTCPRQSWRVSPSMSRPPRELFPFANTPRGYRVEYRPSG